MIIIEFKDGTVIGEKPIGQFSLNGKTINGHGFENPHDLENIKRISHNGYIFYEDCKE